jgi:hypothetical protein
MIIIDRIVVKPTFSIKVWIIDVPVAPPTIRAVSGKLMQITASVRRVVLIGSCHTSDSGMGKYVTRNDGRPYAIAAFALLKRKLHHVVSFPGRLPSKPVSHATSATPAPGKRRPVATRSGVVTT